MNLPWNWLIPGVILGLLILLIWKVIILDAKTEFLMEKAAELEARRWADEFRDGIGL